MYKFYTFFKKSNKKKQNELFLLIMIKNLAF